MKRIALVLLSAALATPAMAGGGEGQAAKPKKEKLICKRMDTTTSRMGSRVCRTAAEWAGTSLDEDQNRLDLLNTAAKTGQTGTLGGASPQH